MEVQIKKEKTKTRAGQYIFINCPEVSYFQWHPFTLTSSPEEDYISVHIRVVGDFAKAFAKSLGCDFNKKGDKPIAEGGRVVSTMVNPALNRILPRVMVDGPFGSASEDFLKVCYEIISMMTANPVNAVRNCPPCRSWYRRDTFRIDPQVPLVSHEQL